VKILITAGSTQMPIDKVRVISNIFKGTTGATIGFEASKRQHETTIIANSSINPTVSGKYLNKNSKILIYNTYDQLENLMKEEISTGNYDIIIHSSAVSDYKVSAIFDDVEDMVAWDKGGKYYGTNGLSMGKIPSGKNLFLALTPTEKLVDKIRTKWGFKGKLVKFKLQVGMTDEQLIEIAKKSRAVSTADFIVANNLEDFNNWNVPKLYIIDSNDNIISCTRKKLADTLLDLLEK
jgi:phosphopantothenate-cysteine ligase/phosphopantothenoylcysteine decarboxylase/phosphopantothenate--cysteine ligase